MTVRTFNYTGKRKLRKSFIEINIYEKGIIPSFSAEIDLKAYSLPLNAMVFIEAYRQAQWMRFDFGTVGKIKEPPSTNLMEFDTPEGILFRLKIVDADKNPGRLLAEADRIRPVYSDRNEPGMVSLLPVQPSDDLGQELFRVNFDSYQSVLLINKNIGDFRKFAGSIHFQAIAFPQIIRTVLMQILITEEYFETDDLDDWKSQWLNFCLTLPGITKLPSSFEKEEILDWIDNTVSSFCRHHQFLEGYLNSNG